MRCRVGVRIIARCSLPESDRLLADLIPNLCTIINTSTSRSLAQIALDTIKSVLEEVKLDMLKNVQLLEKVAHCVQKVLAYKVSPRFV